jgi:hypothetical protein
MEKDPKKTKAPYKFHFLSNINLIGIGVLIAVCLIVIGAVVVFSLASPGTFDISTVVKKLFGIKRFATIEFTAKRAFENFELAMLYLQIIEILFLFFVAVGTVVWIRRRAHKNRIKQILARLHRLIGEIHLLKYRDRLSEEDSLDLELSKKESINVILEMLEHKLLFKKVDDGHYRRVISASLKIVASEQVHANEQIRLVGNIISLIQSI